MMVMVGERQAAVANTNWKLLELIIRNMKH
jgi:hypothetical protein